MPKRKTDRRTERTRQALISAFVKLVLETGYENFTVGEVANRANVGRSTLYVHYSGKEDLLNACIGGLSAVLASIVGQDVEAGSIAKLVDHFAEQRIRNGIFFFPVLPIWVRNLAGLIEPKVVRLARDAGARPLLSAGLISHILAELQIMLIGNCLAVTPIPKSAAIAETLIASTQAMLAALLRTRAGASPLIPK